MHRPRCGWGVLCLAVATTASGPTETSIAPDDPLLRYTGRFDWGRRDRPRCDWSACLVVAHFTGTRVTVRIEDEGRNWFDAFVDGSLAVTFEVTRKRVMASQLVAPGLSDGNHTLQLVKRTEAKSGAFAFGGLLLAAGGSLQPSPRKVTRKVLAIGDSVMCGRAVEGSSPCEWEASGALDNAWLSWPSVLARLLEAEVEVLCWSGRGLVRNYGDPSATSAEPMPHFLDRTLGGSETPLFASSSTDLPPQLILTSLGTNDFSPGPRPDEGTFKRAVSTLNQELHRQHPGALIFNVCGTLETDECCRLVAEGSLASSLPEHVRSVGVRGTLSSTYPGPDYGCDKHPSAVANERIARLLLPVVGSPLGWAVGAPASTSGEVHAADDARAHRTMGLHRGLWLPMACLTTTFFLQQAVAMPW